MKIDTLGGQAFVAIADRGSFQGAADSLHVTQTAITQRLRKLETLAGREGYRDCCRNGTP
ncbi:hypothetical protein LMG28614_00957 [Paraburkholderia ultramafica]|uniref:HTH lysR-type domain-containing protein n=1 Tax=Paraburkholderia ultramafica TaxID=1544867 RepID=A0A6S7AWE6_9BURK|nr:hypothetical protein LMG28614_00957 [Paraburkholderia ultramafica]